jgi:hypothetical protein
VCQEAGYPGAHGHKRRVTTRPRPSVAVLDGLGATAIFVGSALIMVILSLDVGLLGPRSTGMNLEASSDDAARPATGRFERDREAAWTKTT